MADVTTVKAGQCNQPALLRQGLEPVDANLRTAAMLIGQPGTRQQFAQLQITGVVLHQQQ